MNYHKILNTVHETFLRVKNVSIIMLMLVGMIMIFCSTNVYGQPVVSEVKTPLTIIYDGKKLDFVATQNTIEGAIKQSGIYMGTSDITNPPLTTVLNGQTTAVQIIRALPVLISDENQQHLAFSAYSSPTEILNQLKIQIYPEDKISAELILDPVDEYAVGQKVSIDRAPVYTVHVDGEDKIIRSWGKTVGEVLDGKVTLGTRDIIEPAVDSEVVSNEISVTRVNVAEVEETLQIPFETITKNDYSLYQGQIKVSQEGQVGEKKQTVKVTYHNGEVVDRTVLSSEITKDSVAKIIVKGVKPYNAGVWWDTLVSAGQKWGVNPADMFKVMTCESGGNPYSGGYYKGLFQYSPDTWSGASSAYPGGAYRGASITDGEAQVYVTAWKVSVSGWSAWGCKP